jgi:hypothetical protein
VLEKIDGFIDVHFGSKRTEGVHTVAFDMARRSCFSRQPRECTATNASHHSVLIPLPECPN